MILCFRAEIRKIVHAKIVLCKSAEFEGLYNVFVCMMINSSSSCPGNCLWFGIVVFSGLLRSIDCHASKPQDPDQVNPPHDLFVVLL